MVSGSVQNICPLPLPGEPPGHLKPSRSWFVNAISWSAWQQSLHCGDIRRVRACVTVVPKGGPGLWLLLPPHAPQAICSPLRSPPDPQNQGEGQVASALEGCVAPGFEAGKPRQSAPGHPLTVPRHTAKQQASHTPYNFNQGNNVC